MDIKFDVKNLVAFQQGLLDASDDTVVQEMERKALNDMTAVYLRQAIKETPVGERSVKYWEGDKVRTKHFNSEKTRQSWGVGKLVHIGGGSMIEVHNTSSYASFLNDGHRQEQGRFLPWLGPTINGAHTGGRLKKAWVNGQHMHEKAERLVERNAKRILESAANRYLKKVGKV